MSLAQDRHLGGRNSDRKRHFGFRSTGFRSIESEFIMLFEGAGNRATGIFTVFRAERPENLYSGLKLNILYLRPIHGWKGLSTIYRLIYNMLYWKPSEYRVICAQMRRGPIIGTSPPNIVRLPCRCTKCAQDIICCVCPGRASCLSLGNCSIHLVWCT